MEEKCIVCLENFVMVRTGRNRTGNCIFVNTVNGDEFYAEKVAEISSSDEKYRSNNGLIEMAHTRDFDGLVRVINNNTSTFTFYKIGVKLN